MLNVNTFEKYASLSFSLRFFELALLQIIVLITGLT
jgi:hypothetical protein